MEVICGDDAILGFIQTRRRRARAARTADAMFLGFDFAITDGADQRRRRQGHAHRGSHLRRDAAGDSRRGDDAPAAEAGPALPWLSQFVILLKRCFLAHRLDLVDPMLLANMFSVMLLSAALVGPREQATENRNFSTGHLGTVVFECVYWAFQLMILALYTFPADRVVVTKERAAGVVFDQRLLFRKDVGGHADHRPHVAFTFVDLLLRRGLRPSEVGWHLLTLFLNSLCAHSAGLMYWRVDHESEKSYYITNGLHAGDDDVRRVLRARRAYMAEMVWRFEFTRATPTARSSRSNMRGAHYDCAAGRCTVLRERVN